MQTTTRLVHILVTLFATSTQLVSAQGKLYELPGDMPSDYYGWTVSNVGDLTNDSRADILVGAPTQATPGYIDVISGSDGSNVTTIAIPGAGGIYDIEVVYAGDFNNDGCSDFAVGSWQIAHVVTSPGVVYVYSGQDYSILATLQGQTVGDEFGSAMVCLGDITGDGCSDLAVGASADDPNGTLSGRVTVHAGPSGTTIFSMPGEDAYESFGKAVSALDDVTGDGLSELIVGSHKKDTQNGDSSGQVVVLSGADMAVVHTLLGQSAGDIFGWSVAGSEDVSGDSVPDIIVGAPAADYAGYRSGRLYAYSGVDASLVFSVDGVSASEELGSTVASLGDTDGDFRAEVLASAPYYRHQGMTSAGRVDIVSGATGAAISSVYGESPFEQLGRALSSAGDINLDGTNDIVVGGPTANQATGVAKVLTPACGTLSQYGIGCVGSGGLAPTLSATGCASAGAAIHLSLDSGLGGAPGILVAGEVASATPLGGGCTLLVFPLQSVQGIALDGQGAGSGLLELELTLPIPIIINAVHIQAFIVDQGGAKGYSASNGVRVTF